MHAPDFKAGSIRTARTLLETYANQYGGQKSSKSTSLRRAKLTASEDSPVMGDKLLAKSSPPEMAKFAKVVTKKGDADVEMNEFKTHLTRLKTESRRRRSNSLEELIKKANEISEIEVQLTKVTPDNVPATATTTTTSTILSDNPKPSAPKQGARDAPADPRHVSFDDSQQTGKQAQEPRKEESQSSDKQAEGEAKDMRRRNSIFMPIIPIINWHISPSQRLHFNCHFDSIPKQNNLIPASQATSLFLESGLAKEDLSKIW